MDEIDYSKRELDRIFSEMNRDRDEKHRDQMTVLQRIEKQTTLTNGRVTSIELWRSSIRSGLKVTIWILVIIVFPLIIYIFNASIKK